MVWMFSLSLTPNEVLQRSTTSILPVDPTLDNFSGVFQVGLTPRWLLNSVIVTGATTLVTVLLSAMAGYAFARIPFRGKRIAFPLVLAGLMVPREAMFVPLFLMFAEWDMHNTYVALALPRIAAPLGVFIMTAFMAAIPREIEEAAVVDGAGRWRIFWRIMLPMSVPALTALAIFTFVLTWNDYLWPLVSATQARDVHDHDGLGIAPGQLRPGDRAWLAHGPRRHRQPSTAHPLPRLPAPAHPGHLHRQRRQVSLHGPCIAGGVRSNDATRTGQPGRTCMAR